ncbi:MAG: sugar ABC transporter permease [Anaerolineae bacterium]|nr:sugar ABC transporter permease [Anaerolineae bacterium]
MARTLPLPATHRSDSGTANFFNRHARYVFVAPALVAMLLLTAFPIVYTIWMSLHSWQIGTDPVPVFVGLDNFTKLMPQDTQMHQAIVRTLLFTVLIVGAETVLGIILALLFNRSFWGRGFLRSLAILPMVTTPVAIALIFVMMMHPTSGVLNYFLSFVGLRSNWIYDQNTALFSLALVDTWQWTPLIMLITLAALATLPLEPFEAARIDGANSLQLIRYITLPLIRPAVVVAVIFRGIDALKTFDIIFVMTKGGPGTATETLNIYLFDKAFSYFDIGYASAIVVAFFAIILGFVVFAIRLRRTSW